MNTPILYKTEIQGFYDLEKNNYQRNQMLKVAIPGNILVHGSIENYLQALESQVSEQEFLFQPKVVRWWILKQQIKFIKKYLKGEIKDEKEIQAEIKAEPESGNNDEGTISPD